MEKPLVSVCTITYGHEKYIAETIKGVLMQEVDFPIEFIIADDCSLDDTETIVQTLIETHTNGHWIKYTKHSENKGMNPNFAWALNQCNGKYIALCEGDDYWTDPLKLQKQYTYLEENSKVNLCFHEVAVINEKNDVIEDNVYKRLDGLDIKKLTRDDLLRRGNFMHTVSVMYRNKEFSLPPEFFKSSVGDYFLHILMSKTGLIAKLEDKMAVYRRGSGIYSTLNRFEVAKKQIGYQAALLSWITDSRGKEILLEKIFHSLKVLDRKMQAANQNPQTLSKSLSWKNIGKTVILKLLKK